MHASVVPPGGVDRPPRSLERGASFSSAEQLGVPPAWSWSDEPWVETSARRARARNPCLRSIDLRQQVEICPGPEPDTAVTGFSMFTLGERSTEFGRPRRATVCPARRDPRRSRAPPGQTRRPLVARDGAFRHGRRTTGDPPGRGGGSIARVGMAAGPTDRIASCSGRESGRRFSSRSMAMSCGLNRERQSTLSARDRSGFGTAVASPPWRLAQLVRRAPCAGRLTATFVQPWPSRPGEQGMPIPSPRTRYCDARPASICSPLPCACS